MSHRSVTFQSNRSNPNPVEEREQIQGMKEWPKWPKRFVKRWIPFGRDQRRRWIGCLPWLGSFNTSPITPWQSNSSLHSVRYISAAVICESDRHHVFLWYSSQITHPLTPSFIHLSPLISFIYLSYSFPFRYNNELSFGFPINQVTYHSLLAMPRCLRTYRANLDPNKADNLDPGVELAFYVNKGGQKQRIEELVEAYRVRWARMIV